MSEQKLSSGISNVLGRHRVAYRQVGWGILQSWKGKSAALEQRIEGLEDALGQIRQWANAYPTDIFPEPDFAKAASLLKDGGMTLDGISASNMRHVIEGVGGIAKSALAQQEEA